jgi:16S rRNA (cytosine967-C5)-methyltransferase
LKVTPARWAALDTLRAVRRGELADLALGRALERVSPRDRGWTQELVYGTLRLRGRIDYLLARFVRRGLDALEADVLDTLRLGAYQLLEMGSVPVYAAVSQAVEMAKAVGGRGAGGLVNGVLHALDRGWRDVEFPQFERDPIGHLVTWGSHPRWLVERWVARYGAEGARGLVEANNRRPELYLRPIGLSAGDAVERLEAVGIAAEPVPFAPDALRVPPPTTAIEALAVVPAVVQDPAAGLVVRYAAVPPGTRVADLCAAPGGKAVALAESAAYLVAADLSFGRLSRIRENVDRIGGLPVGPVVADARFPPIRPVDAVLVDVPCTGTGTLRRHPDGKWRLKPEDLEALTRLQREILEAAATRVAPGGLLIYSTCSLEREENEDQVGAFLERHPEFAPEPPPAGTVEAAMIGDTGQLIVLPQAWGVDGSFAARLRRNA